MSLAVNPTIFADVAFKSAVVNVALTVILLEVNSNVETFEVIVKSDVTTFVNVILSKPPVEFAINA